MASFTSILIPTLIIFVTNVFSGTHGSIQYEKMTAIFGWCAGISLSALFIVYVLLIPFPLPWLSYSKNLLAEIFYFSLLTALSRDYEKIIKPIVDKIHKNK